MQRWMLTACLALSGLALAQSNGEPGDGLPRGPPPEALQACSGLQENATCSVTFGDHTMTGTCHSGPQGEAAACMPSGGPPGGGHHHGPPQEALDACNGVQTGASCSFIHQGETRTGTCQPGPDNLPAACMPPRPDQTG
jgi:hypothetical protein